MNVTIKEIEKQDTYEFKGKTFRGTKFHGTDGKLYTMNQRADETAPKEGDSVSGEEGDFQQFGSWLDGPKQGEPMLWKKLGKARIVGAALPLTNGAAPGAQARREMTFAEFATEFGLVENTIAKVLRIIHPDASADAITARTGTTVNTWLIRYLDTVTIKAPDVDAMSAAATDDIPF